MHIFFKKTTHSYGKNAKLSPRNFLYCVCFDTLLQRACYRDELAKSRGLHGNVGYVGVSIAWVIIFSWVKYIFVWVQNFLRRVFFSRGSAFFTRLDYFSILQLMNWAFFFVSLFSENLDQTLFDPFGIFEWLIRYL